MRNNKSKIERLGVEEEVIEKYGAVSKETAYQMALGLLKSGNCDISVSTTGIAGPNSDGTNKPVGLVYIAQACPQGARFPKRIYIHSIYLPHCGKQGRKLQKQQ